MNIKRIIREEMDKGYYIIEDEDGPMLIHYEDLMRQEPEQYEVIKILHTSDFDKAKDLYYKYLNNPLNEEMDDMQWIEDVPNELPKKEKWVIVNDVNADSLEESKLIQNYLFKQGFKWITGRNYYLPQKVYSILANPTAGIFQHNRLGTLTYYSGENPRHIEEADEVIEEFKSQGKGVYYWSDIKPNVIMESDDMEWISDVKSNQDIAQEIADESEIKIYPTGPYPSFEYLHSSRYSGILYNPHFSNDLGHLANGYRFYFQPFRFPSLLPIFLNYCQEQYGLTEKDSQDVWERFKNIINYLQYTNTVFTF